MYETQFTKISKDRMIIKELQKQVIKFRDARDWKQFHNPKDLAVGLAAEIGEVLEHFQWKNGRELDNYLKKNKKAISEELADVMHYVLLLADHLKIDIEKAFLRKVKINEKRYPIRKSRGSSKKYTEL